MSCDNCRPAVGALAAELAAARALGQQPAFVQGDVSGLKSAYVAAASARVRALKDQPFKGTCQVCKGVFDPLGAIAGEIEVNIEPSRRHDAEFDARVGAISGKK